MASGATIELHSSRTAPHVWPVPAAAFYTVTPASIFFWFGLNGQAPAPVNAATLQSIVALVLTAVIPGRHRAQHNLLTARDQLLKSLTGRALPMQLAGSDSMLVDIMLATSGQPEQR